MKKIFHRSKVGDRYVKEKNEKNSIFNLGGEQSGHIILGKFANTKRWFIGGIGSFIFFKKTRKASKLLRCFFKPLPQV